jgi:ribosomal protein S6
MTPRDSSSAQDDTDVLDNEDGVRLYECCVLIAYPLSQKDEAAAIKEVEAAFAEAGGKLIMKDAWGRRGLAYPIKGSMEAAVIVYYYELDTQKIKEIEQALKIMKNVLRHMFVKPPKNYKMEKYADKYEQWLKERESIDQKRAREREQRLTEQVAARAKRKATTVKKTDKPAGKPVSGEVITKQVDKLLTDDIDSL